MSSQNPYENYPPSTPLTDSSQLYGQPPSSPYRQPSSGYGIPSYGQPPAAYGAPYMQQQLVYAYAPVRISDPGKGLAITGMVLGIISLCLVCSPILATILAVPGLIFSIVGRRSITGKGMAIAGMVLSIITLAIAVFFFAIFGALFWGLR